MSARLTVPENLWPRVEAARLLYGDYVDRFLPLCLMQDTQALAVLREADQTADKGQEFFGDLADGRISELGYTGLPSVETLLDCLQDWPLWQDKRLLASFSGFIRSDARLFMVIFNCRVLLKLAVVSKIPYYDRLGTGASALHDINRFAIQTLMPNGLAMPGAGFAQVMRLRFVLALQAQSLAQTDPKGLHATMAYTTWFVAAIVLEFVKTVHALELPGRESIEDTGLEFARSLAFLLGVPDDFFAGSFDDLERLAEIGELLLSDTKQDKQERQEDLLNSLPVLFYDGEDRRDVAERIREVVSILNPGILLAARTGDTAVAQLPTSGPSSVWHKLTEAVLGPDEQRQKIRALSYLLDFSKFSSLTDEELYTKQADLPVPAEMMRYW